MIIEMDYKTRNCWNLSTRGSLGLLLGAVALARPLVLVLLGHRTLWIPRPVAVVT